MRSIGSIWVLLLLCIILSQPASASYVTPPLQNVSDYNLLLSSSGALDGSYNDAIAFGASVPFSFNGHAGTLSSSGSLDIAGFSVMVDNSTYPVDGLSLLLASGSNMSHLGYFSEGDIFKRCDINSCSPISDACAAHCDYDGDYCVEYENSSSFGYDLMVDFSFKNISESVETHSSMVQVPDLIFSAMQDSSGADTLDINISGYARFLYVLDDRQMGFGDTCYDQFINGSADIPISLNASYPVAGKNRLFFLVAPILREQWYRNNHFDVIVLSQSPLYQANTYLNSNITRNLTLRNYDINETQYGLERIVSNITYLQPPANLTTPENPDNQTNSTNSTNSTIGWQMVEGFSENFNLTSPYLLEDQNHSFAYIYVFNSTYDGLGINNLSIIVYDSFGQMGGYSENITSNMLSFNNQTAENGAPINSTFARKSKGFDYGVLSPVQMSLGLVALLVILMFLNSWLLGDAESKIF